MVYGGYIKLAMEPPVVGNEDGRDVPVKATLVNLILN